MKTILDLHNIYYSYHTSHGETRALSNLSFSLAPGEFAAVVGPSGCGKSTLLSLICGLMKPQTGEILLNGEPVLGNSPQIGYMLQHDHLFAQAVGLVPVVGDEEGRALKACQQAPHLAL